MKEEVYTHRSLETGGTACHAGAHREAPGSVRRQREHGEARAGVSIVVYMGKNG